MKEKILHKRDNKMETLQLRMSKEFKTLLKKRADAENLSMTQYVINLVLKDEKASLS